MKNWLAGILCAVLVIGAAAYYFINNMSKIKYESDILLVYSYGGGMGTYVDTHTTTITIYSNGSYDVEIPPENSNSTKKYKISGTISPSDFEELMDVMQKNNLKKVKKNKLSDDSCLDCGFEKLTVYYTVDDTYTVESDQTIMDDDPTKEEEIFINIRDGIARAIPEEKVLLLERVLAEDYGF